MSALKGVGSSSVGGVPNTNQSDQTVKSKPTSHQSKQSTIINTQECLFFLGCPFLGKTTYFEHVYEVKGYEHICFEKDRVKTLTRLFNLLSQNKRVIIDDERTMSSKEARSSLIERIKNEHPECIIKCITFVPRFKKLQINISKSFYLCEHLDMLDYEKLEYISSCDEFINQVYEEGVESDKIIPSKDERFESVTTREMPIFINRPEHDFCYHALVLDACSSKLFSYDSKKRKIVFSDTNNLKQLIMQWTERHKDTRVIVVFKDKESFRISLNIPANHINSINIVQLIRDAITELSIPSPVYYCTDTESKSLELIFCQIFYMYSIDLEHSLFVTDNSDRGEDFSNLFSTLPIIDYSSFLSIQDLKTYHAVVPVTSSNQNHIDFEFHPNYKGIDSPKPRRFPLLNMLSESENITDECHFEIQKKGIHHGIVLPRTYISYFEYQEDFFESVPEESQNKHGFIFGDDDMRDEEDDAHEENPLLKLKKLKEMQANREHIGKTSDLITSVRDPFGNISSDRKTSQDLELSTSSQIDRVFNPSSSSNSVADTSLLKSLSVNMSVHHIMNHFGMVFFQRGRDYKNDFRIDNFKTKIINDVAFKLYSTCVGSREEPYKQESIIKEGRLLKAICNCPIGSEGLCKHVCAQVLAYRDKENYMKEKAETKIISKSERILPTPIPFSMLDPVTEDWCVKVRVVKKHTEKSWANERGSGRVAAITISDELACSNDTNKQVKLIMFNDFINEYYDEMEEGEVYFVNRGHLIKRNGDDTFEIQLHASSVVRNIHTLGRHASPFKDNKSPDYKKIYNEKIKAQNFGAIAFEEYPNVNAQQIVADDSTLVAPSPEKKRKQEVDTPHESPTKKVKPSSDTRFDNLLAGGVSLEAESDSQRSIIASQRFSQEHQSQQNSPILGLCNDHHTSSSVIKSQGSQLSSQISRKSNTKSQNIIDVEEQDEVVCTVPSQGNQEKGTNNLQEWFIEEDASAGSQKTFEDIFFTPAKKKNQDILKSESNQILKSESNQIQMSSSPIYTPPLASVQSHTEEEAVLSPRSLSQHNKPPVVDVVYLSDNDEVEILEQVTPNSNNRRQVTSKMSPMEETPPYKHSKETPKSTESMTSSSSSKKKISLKNLLDDNDMMEF